MRTLPALVTTFTIPKCQDFIDNIKGDHLTGGLTK